VEIYVPSYPFVDEVISLHGEELNSGELRIELERTEEESIDSEKRVLGKMAIKCYKMFNAKEDARPFFHHGLALLMRCLYPGPFAAIAGPPPIFLG
jgi:hypothetical protein